MNWLDRAIGFISPKRAYERQLWRDASRNYDAGNNDRLNSGWTAVNGTAEQINQASRDTIRARARDLERNSDIAEAIIGPFERNVVGTGITVQASVKTDDNHEDDVLNNYIEEYWDRWRRKENCDITGQQTFEELQEMAIRRLKVDGGIIFVKCYTKDGFKLQSREVDDLDTSMQIITTPERKRIIGGIELDEHNKPTAYYLKQYTPDGFYTGKSDRIEANRIIFLWKKERPSQVREMSQLSKTLPRVRDVNEFVEALSVKERILACLAVFITKNNPGAPGRGVKTDPKTSYPVRSISPGMIQELQPGENITAVTPNGTSTGASEFISTQQRLAGGGQGLSYEAVSRDMSQVNYSSARQGLLEDQKTYKRWQKFLIEHLCREVYEEVITEAVLSGKLKIAGFFNNKEKYLEHKWIAPGWSWIDPLKEVKANETALSTGQETLASICASKGQDYREVLEQLAKEQKLAEYLGLKLGGGTSAQTGKTGTENGDAGTQNNN